jgi:transcriptional regulator with XRE-family HTH domain
LDYSKAFGRRVRSIREAAKRTQQEVAERGGLDPKYMSVIENGSVSPTLDTIRSIAKGLNAPIEDLVLLEGEDADGKLLRKRIDAVLDSCDDEHLRRVYRIIRDVIEP